MTEARSYVTLKRAAQTLGVHEQTLRNWEKRGVMAPIVEAHLAFKGRAGYDDLLEIETICSREGRVRLRFESRLVLADSGKPVAEGYTVHALTDPSGKPIRLPEWIEDLLKEEEDT